MSTDGVKRVFFENDEVDLALLAAGEAIDVFYAAVARKIGKSTDMTDVRCLTVAARENLARAGGIAKVGR